MNIKKILIQIEQIGLLILLLSLAVIGYRSVSVRVADLVDYFKIQMIGKIEDEFKVSVEYASMSPSLLNAINVKNIKLYTKGSDDAFVFIEKIKVTHDLFGLLFSGETAITNITAQGVHISFDPARDGEILRSLSGGKNDTSSNISLEDFFTQSIRIRNWDISYRNDGVLIQGRGNHISMHQIGEYLRVDLTGSLAYEHSDKSLNMLSLDAEVRGTLKNDLRSFSLESEFHDIDTNLAAVEDQRLNISYQEDKLTITKIKDKKPYDLNLVFDRDEIIVSLIADEFYPSSLISFKSELEKINPWLDTELSGQGELSIERATGILQYKYNGDAFLRNSSLPFSVGLELDVQGDDLQVQSNKFRIKTQYGDVDWTGHWVFRNGFPEGYLRLQNVLIGDSNKLKAVLSLRNIDDYYLIRSNTLFFNNGDEAGDLRLLISRDESRYIFSLQSVLVPGNEWDDRLTVDGELSFNQGLQIKSSYKMTEMSLDSITTLLNMPFLNTLNKNYSGINMQSEGTIALDNRQVALQINRLTALLPGEDNRLTFSGYYGNHSLEIYNFEMLLNQNSLWGSGTARFNDSRISMTSLLNINDVKYNLNGVYSNGQVSVMSTNGLRVQVLKNGQSSYLGTLEAEKFPFSWSGQKFETNLNLKGRYKKDEWEIFLNDSSLVWKNSSLLENPELSMTLFVAPGVVNVFSLGYKDDFSELTGNGSLFYDLSNRIYNGSLVLKNESGESDNESYDAYAAYNNGSLSMTLQVNQGLLDRFSKWNMKGRVDSVLSLDGTLQSPVINGYITAPKLEWNNNPFGIQGRLQLNEKTLEVYELNINRNNLYLKRGLGVFDLKEGDLVFTAAVSNVSPEEKDKTLAAVIESGFTVQADTGLSIDFGNLKVPILEDFSGRFRIHPITWNGIVSFSSKTFEFSRKGSVFSTVLLSDPEQKLEYNSVTKIINASLKQDFPISMNLSGSLDPEDLNLDVSNLVLDLNLINYIMPKDPSLDNRYVVFRDGSEMAGDLKITGTLKDPNLSGRLQSRNLRVLTPYTTADIKETSLIATVVDDVVKTNEFFIPVGNSGGVRAQGVMSLRGWGIREYNLNIAVVGDPGAPISYNANGLSGTGSVSGLFRLYGDSAQGNFDGKVVVEELVGSLGEKTDREHISLRNTSYPFRLNLQIEMGKNVLIILPNPQVEIVRATAEPGEIINLSIDSRNHTLSMTGGVSIRNGEIYYFDRTFQMTEGSITFNEDQDTFNPFLNIEAEIDTTDQNGDNVTIYLVYRNPVMDEFQPSFRSNPSMPEDQIVSLFGQSLIPYDNTGDADISRIVLATGGMVSQYGFVKPLELALKDSLNLDNVTIKTEILENALLDQLNREESVTETGSMFSMAKYLDNTSLYLGKFVGDSLYFSAGVVVDYDQLYGLRSYLNGVKLVPDLTIEMRTPFFLVFWNYNNRNAFDLHNTDFMKNNAIGLEWRYSY